LTTSIDIVKSFVQDSLQETDLTRSLSDTEKAEKRAELVRTATAILEAEGEAGLTLRRLAAAAGISRQTPYLYFADKAALLDAVRVAGLRRLTGLCRRAVTGAGECAGGGGPQGWSGKMRAMGEAYLRFGLAQPELYSLIFETGPKAGAGTGAGAACCGHGAGAMSADYRAAVKDYIALADGPLQRGYEAGLLNLPAARLGPALWAATHGLLMLRRAGNFPDDESFFQVWTDLSQVLARGFFTGPDTP
jgi:AcrR family transcriptional regulator